jgi:hypothetical protein
MGETSRPNVIVDLDFDGGLLFLVVRNLGDRPALDVTTTFNRKLVGLGGRKDVSALPLFRNIPFLAPNKEIRTLLDTAASWFARRRTTTIIARVAYRDAEGNHYRETMTHDLEIYREIAYVKGD